jgi:hypothetical protein
MECFVIGSIVSSFNAGCKLFFSSTATVPGRSVIFIIFSARICVCTYFIGCLPNIVWIMVPRDVGLSAQEPSQIVSLASCRTNGLDVWNENSEGKTCESRINKQSENGFFFHNSVSDWVGGVGIYEWDAHLMLIHKKITSSIPCF